MLVGTDGWVCVVFVWEETGVPRGNPSARLGDQMTISFVSSNNISISDKHNKGWRGAMVRSDSQRGVCLSGVSLNPVKDVRCVLEQNRLPLLLNRGWMQEWI